MADCFEDAHWKAARQNLVFKNFSLSRFVSKHKIRFDRGRIYYGYAAAFTTAIIVHVLDLIREWWIYPIIAVLTVVVIYCIGYIDQRLGILSKEQERYSDTNPFNAKLLGRLDDIETLLKNSK